MVDPPGYIKGRLTRWGFGMVDSGGFHGVQGQHFPCVETAVWAGSPFVFCGLFVAWPLGARRLTLTGRIKGRLTDGVFG